MGRSRSTRTSGPSDSAASDASTDAAIDAGLDADPNACPVGGALVNRPHPTLGTAALTLDPVTKLAWLDTTLTQNQSHDTVANRMVPGQALTGFRFATVAEVETLFAHASVTTTNSGTNFVPAQTLQALIGVTRPNFGTANDTVAYTSTPSGAGNVTGCLLRSDATAATGNYSCGFFNAVTATNPVVGHWVVLATPACN